MASRARNRRRFKSSTSRLTVQRYAIMGHVLSPLGQQPPWELHLGQRQGTRNSERAMRFRFTLTTGEAWRDAGHSANHFPALLADLLTCRRRARRRDSSIDVLEFRGRVP